MVIRKCGLFLRLPRLGLVRRAPLGILRRHLHRLSGMHFALLLSLRARDCQHVSGVGQWDWEHVKDEDAFGEGRLVPRGQPALPCATMAPDATKPILPGRLCQPPLLSGVIFDAFADFV